MANIVQTSLFWPDGNETHKVIDMDDPTERRRFGKIAHKCLMLSGKTVCIGMNDDSGVAKIALVTTEVGR